MSNDELHINKLIDYLDDQMTDAEKAAFQENLQNDEGMQQELNRFMLARDLVKNHGLAKQVATVHTKMMTEMDASSQKNTATVKPLYTRVLKYAAVIILMLGLFSLYKYQDITSDKLYKEQFTLFTLNEFRGNGQKAGIEQLYTEKKYDEVIAVYRQLPNVSPAETFIAGQAFLAKENFTAALENFRAVIEKNNLANTGILQDDAEYYLALTYLKNRETSEALSIFKKIHQNKKHLYYNKVNGWFIKKLQVLNWKIK